MNYFFNQNRLIGQFLAPVFRDIAALRIWIEVMLTPIEAIKQNFDVFRVESQDELLRNGQVCNLTYLLNNLFDNDLRRIAVVDSLLYPDCDFDVNVHDDYLNALILSNMTGRPVILSDSVALSIVNQSDIGLAVSVSNIVKRYKITGKSFRVVMAG